MQSPEGKAALRQMGIERGETETKDARLAREAVLRRQQATQLMHHLGAGSVAS
jgi:hypothetical protein